MSVLTRLLTAYRRIEGGRIPHGGLVLDVGSGATPHPRAHVACDGLENDAERCGPLRIDRPFVWADVQRLPFANKAFAYTVCSHVLEHVGDPAALLSELQRVSDAGYIETPSASSELIIPYVYHLSRVSIRDGGLLVSFKPRWDDTLPPAYDDVLADLRRDWWCLYAADPRYTLMQFRWNNGFKYDIRGTPIAVKEPSAPAGEPSRSFLRKIAIKLLYWWLTPKLTVPLERLLACPACHGALDFDSERARCHVCGVEYGRYRGAWDFRTSVGLQG